MLQGAGEVTQCCESETINTPMTKRLFYEYSEPASPPWEANMLVPFSFLLLETREALPVNGDWQLSGFAFCMQQIPHLHHLYTPSCKVAHPFPHFTKEIRASFGNTSQKSSVYAELKRFGFNANEFCFDFFDLFVLETV